MARPREFDEATALDAAMSCFWSNGYEATSVRLLADTMGLTGASLYNAFGDKRSLFRRAFKSYLARFDARVAAMERSQSSSLAVIRSFFTMVIEELLRDTEHKGCLLVNSAIELAPHDAEFQASVADGLAHVESFFRRNVAIGQKEGTITRSQSAQDLASLLLAILIGIRVLARSRPERNLLQGLAGPILEMLDPKKE